MKTNSILPFLMGFLFISIASFSQEGDQSESVKEYASYHQERHQIKTIFNNRGQHASGGYGALGNKFTTINGNYANMAEVYGGWYINHRFLIGIASRCDNK